jgi:hypothetical protein
MALNLTTIAAKDGNGASLSAGVRANSESALGTGPFDLLHILIDSLGAEVVGTTADAPWTGTGNGSLIAILKAISTELAAKPALTWTQTSVTLPAGSNEVLIGANSNRRALRWMNVGTNPMTVVPGAGPAIAGAGMNYTGAVEGGYQGGSDSFVGDVSAQAFAAISTAGTTVVVWEGQ